MLKPIPTEQVSCELSKIYFLNFFINLSIFENFSFLLSFVLPFIKHTATHNGVEQIKIYTGIHFLLNYFYILLPAIACYVAFLYLKKSYLKYLAIVLYGCFIVLGITSGDILKVAPVDYYRLLSALIPETILIGLPINIVLGIVLISKIFCKRT